MFKISFEKKSSFSRTTVSILHRYRRGNGLLSKKKVFSSRPSCAKLAGFKNKKIKFLSCFYFHPKPKSNFFWKPFSLLTIDQRVKVADFGLSKEGSKLKRSGHFSRKTSIIYKLPEPLRWMSPESVEHKYYDESTDIWR